MVETKVVVVTGGAGQIAYSLLFRLASGEVWGPNQPISLRILEVEEALGRLEGVCMELLDCAFPLLEQVEIGSNPLQIFRDADLALLVGAKPRGKGMERSDLLQSNAAIFSEQGKALEKVAKRNVEVIVVGNPCNTNCLLALKNAPSLDPKRFHALSHLDLNRAYGSLADKASVPVGSIDRLHIWGNHSTTMVPDYTNVRIRGKPIREVIVDEEWLQGEFIRGVQKRGALVIEKRGSSSAASAANAVIDCIRDLDQPTAKGDWFSSSIYSKGNPYNIDEDLIFSFPLVSRGSSEYAIVEGLLIDPLLLEKIRMTERELQEERRMVLEMIK